MLEVARRSTLRGRATLEDGEGCRERAALARYGSSRSVLTSFARVDELFAASHRALEYALERALVRQTQSVQRKRLEPHTRVGHQRTRRPEQRLRARLGLGKLLCLFLKTNSKAFSKAFG